MLFAYVGGSADIDPSATSELCEPTSVNTITINGKLYLGPQVNHMDIVECLKQGVKRDKSGEVNINKVTVKLWQFYNLVQKKGGWLEVSSAYYHAP